MRIKKVLKEILIIALGSLFMICLLFGAWLQTSYRYCPPTEEELNSYNTIERIIYEIVK